MFKRPLSLRARVVIWFVVSFAVLQVPLTLLALYQRQQVVRDFRDNRLHLWADAIAHRLEFLGRDWTQEELDASAKLSNELRFVILRDAGGKLVHATGLEDNAMLPPINISVTTENKRKLGTATLTPAAAEKVTGTSEQLRYVTSPLRTDSGKRYFLQVGVNHEFLGDLPQSAFSLFIAALPIGVLAAIVAAWFVSRRFVHSIADLSEQIKGISPQTLEDSEIELSEPDDEMAQLQIELNKALARIDEGYKAQDEFISNVAHDLKSPVAVILAESQALASTVPMPEECEQFRLSVEEEMRRLGKLIESFLTLARTEQGEFLARKDIVSINDVVVDSIAHSTPLAEHREVRLIPTLVDPSECDVEPNVRGDSGLLRTMIDNLISNAVRFSPPEAVVDIRTDCCDSHATVSVRDRGPGIREDVKDHIFDRFVRVESKGHRGGSSGLGLAIAHSVAVLHGGSVHVENCDDGGCVFVIALPLLPRIVEFIED